MNEVLISFFRFVNILFLGLFTYSVCIRIKKEFSEHLLSPVMVGLYGISSFFLLFIRKADLIHITGFDYFAGLSLFLFLLIYYSFRVINQVLLKTNRLFYDIAFMLIAVGLPELYRLNDKLGIKQLQVVFLGCTAFILLQLFLQVFAEKIKIRKTMWPQALIMIFLLLVMTQVFGSLINGSRNWIRIMGTAFQPSEFIKLIYVYFLASTLDRQLTTRRFVAVGSAVAAICGFYVLQRDLGSAFIYLAVFICFVLIRDKRFVFFGSTVASTGVFAFIAYMKFNHIRTRVNSWLDPWKYVSNESYQITQSLFAIASGGLIGRGLTMGDPTAIPAVSTDFIYSAICEELGILTGILILFLFLFITYAGFHAAAKISNPVASGVMLGLTSMTAIQTCVIIMGVTNLIPITGVTLPFVSYGGSSLLYQFLSLGVLTFLFDRYVNKKNETNREELIALLEHRFRTRKKTEAPKAGETV